MSNQSVDGFQGSAPFISDKKYSKMSMDELRHVLEEEKQKFKDTYNERQKLIRYVKKIKRLKTRN